jgi:hypothetical protein
MIGEKAASSEIWKAKKKKHTFFLLNGKANQISALRVKVRVMARMGGDRRTV